MSSSRPMNQGQLATKLPPVHHFITGHDESGKAIVEAMRPAQWKPFDNDAMAFNQVYTTTFPADLNQDKDLKTHDELEASGKLGLVNPHGTVCRMVDFAPGFECLMHRTQSVDYGIVLEGSVEMILDDGKRELLQRGDVAIQRATMHAWKNPSETEWTRMCFILQDCQSLTIGGKKFGEDLGKGTEGLLPSGND